VFRCIPFTEFLIEILTVHLYVFLRQVLQYPAAALWISNKMKKNPSKMSAQISFGRLSEAELFAISKKFSVAAFHRYKQKCEIEKCGS